MSSVKIFLNEGEMPTHWYNIQADFPKPMPPVIHPGTKEPIGPQDLAPLFPMGLIAQEVSQERYIEIPDEVQDIYKIWRPTPLIRARNWEKGIPTSRLLDSGLRHAFQYLEGCQDEDHLAQAAWNFLALLHTEEMIERGVLPKELNDLPSYQPVGADPSEWRQKNGKEEG